MNFPRKLLLAGLLGIGGTALLGALGLAVSYLAIAPNLPPIEALKDIRLQVPMRIYTRDGRLIAEFGEQKRTPIRYEETPELMIKAILAAEDDRFFEHPGVDYQGILRAALNLARTGEKSQGGSTITMQVARNFFLTSEKTYLRKLSEIFLALKIDKELSKEEILELYLNKIYLGNR
ncbi:MAG: transglycosylase domain-containing protein, partial [Nitrospiraceae bacterium]